jgi:hypothetical protein
VTHATLALLALAACRPDGPGPGGGGDDDDAPHHSAPTTPGTGRVELLVVGGEGGGRHLPGSEVWVAATVDPTTTVVTGWDATPEVDAPREWNGTVTVPAGGLVLEARTRRVEVELTERTYALPGGERTARVAAVEDPRGVVMFFHGASYSTRQLDEPSPRNVLLHLVDAGYTVVAPQSAAEVASGSGGWVATRGSADHRAVEALWGELAADGTLPAGAPRVAWGMSSGGQFAHAVGAALELDVVLAHCAPGTSAELSTTTAATGWYLAERDGTFPTAVDVATEAQAWFTARGVSTDLVVHPRTPVTPLRFTRIPGVDEDRSRSVGQALLDRGLAGEDGLLRESGAEVVAATADLFAADPPEVRAGLAAELEILAADHELYDDAANRMVAFLNTALAR